MNHHSPPMPPPTARRSPPTARLHEGQGRTGAPEGAMVLYGSRGREERVEKYADEKMGTRHSSFPGVVVLRP